MTDPDALPERMKDHNARVNAELDRAKAGDTIDLSALMGAKEELDVEVAELHAAAERVRRERKD